MSRFLLNRYGISFPDGLEVEYEQEKFKIYRFNDFGNIVKSIKDLNRLSEEQEDELDNIISDKLPTSLTSNFKIKDHLNLEEGYKSFLDSLIYESYGYGYFTYQEKILTAEEIKSIELQNINENLLNKFRESNTDLKPIVFLNDDRTYIILSTFPQIKIWQEKNQNGKVGLIRKINSEYKILEILKWTNSRVSSERRIRRPRDKRVRSSSG